MKFAITTFFAALAVMACGQAAMPGQALAGDTAIVVKVADQDVVLPAPRVRRSHRVLAYREPYYPYPVACESVLFPRSPACDGRPASYGWYATYPWNNYRSH